MTRFLAIAIAFGMLSSIPCGVSAQDPDAVKPEIARSSDNQVIAVVKGEEALNIISELRHQIALQPSHDVAVEVDLADGAVLRLSSISNSPEPMVTLARPDPSLGLGQFRQISMRIDVVDGEPVITLAEV
jgi:hypothetical protein